MLSRLRHGESGISLTEVLVAGAMAAVIATAFILIFSSFNRSVAIEEDRAAALGEVQSVATGLATELRQAVPLVADGPLVESLESAWPSPELIFYSDRLDTDGPERYRYYVTNCASGLCELWREIRVADSGGPPWTYTGAGAQRYVAGNIIAGGDPLFLGADWDSGARADIVSCDPSSPCSLALLEFTVRIDPSQRSNAEEALLVRHEVRLRNAG